MAAEKITVTIDEALVTWARRTAKQRGMTLSALVAETLGLQRQHQAHDMYLKKVLSGLSEGDIEHRTAEAHRAIFGQHLQ